MSHTRPTSFLHQVARHYAALPPQELCDYCFVFPNQRSGRFFLEELQHQFQTGYIMPAVTPLTEFVSELASDLRLTPSLQIASSIETLMALYKAYEEIFGEQAQSFDHFVYWANIIVNDFNEVDLALVDPRKLYTNLSDLHDIRSNYIDKELREDIKRIFGKAFSAINEDNGDTLWANHSSQEETDGEIKQRFLSLWQQLDTLYTRYHEQLGRQGLTTLGHLMREVADRITQQGVSSLRHRRYVMVGFAMLSASQMKIFKAMKQVANFWWDDASPLLKQDVDCNHAANLIKGLHAEFPEMHVDDIDPDFAARGQDIKMVAAPGNIAQAKQAFREIGKLIDSRSINPDNAINTAIVMPDETLFVPLINSVDRRITKINATLGYPLRNSSIVSLMHLVAIMHHKAGHDKQQETTFYREDVKNVLSHPIIKTVFVHDASVVNQEIDRQGLFNVPQSLFKGTGFEPLFVSAPQANEKEQATAYINQLREFATTVYKHINATHNSTEPSANEHDRPVMTLQSAFIIQYLDALRQVVGTIERYGVPVHDSTLFFLIDRLIGSYVVPFSGEPLQGLQIMGMLETRCLDFDNVVILSMNERVFPRRHTIGTFIPTFLRRAFFMPTPEQQEGLIAYHFYRLLSRASNIILIYDSSSQIMGSSEPSRFISQLQMVYGRTVTASAPQARLTTHNLPEISVKAGTMARDKYVGHRSEERIHYLSASSINGFITCPLKFYLHYLQGLRSEDPESDFMGPGTMGDIVHDILRECYFPNKVSCDVDARYLHDFRDHRLRQVAIRKINSIYLHLDEPHLDDSLSGESFIMLDSIVTLARRAIDYDLDNILKNDDDYITVLECEQEHKIENLELNGVKFNFTFKPDRVDQIHSNNPALDNMLRMVDYKTGRDITTMKDMKDINGMFNIDLGYSKRCHGVMQLLLYCHAYQTAMKQTDAAIMPVIYKLSNIAETGAWLNGKQYVFGSPEFSTADKEFKEGLGDVVKQMMDPDNAYKQSPVKAQNCDYCAFIELCRRQKSRK